VYYDLLGTSERRDVSARWVSGPATLASKSPPSIFQYENTDQARHDCQGQVTAEGKAKETDMRRYQRQHHKYGDPRAPANSMPLH